LLLSHPVSMEDGSSVVAWELIAQQVGKIDPGVFWTFVLLATAIKAVGMLSSMCRWVLVLRGQGIELPFWHIFGSFLIGRAIGTFLPSTAGLDGYTLYDAARFSGRSVEVTAGKLLEKVVGFSGIFLSYLVALPFGYVIFGDDAALYVLLTLPIPVGIIAGLLLVLWFPGLVQWLLENLPIPAKARLEGLVLRISRAAAAYRHKKGLVGALLFLSFLVHFTTAVMYFFTALAIGAALTASDFWPVVFGSSIQILATVLSPFTIAGEGVREAAQYVLLGSLIGPAAAIVSAALGFWAAEAPTMLGFIFWLRRGSDYRPAYCRVNGEQVDYEAAARDARSLEGLSIESDGERDRSRARAEALPPLAARARHSAGLGLGSGILAGLLIGSCESLVIGLGGFGADAQVLWYGPLAYAAVLGGLAALGGALLGLLPMDKVEIEGWTPSLATLATLVPFGLAIGLFRLRRDVFLEQMPPLPVLAGVLALGGAVALILFFGGRRIFASPLGRLVRPLPALGLLLGVCAAGAIGAALVGDDGSGSAPPASVPSQLADRPNIILVMVDTLRADHLSCYGAEQVKTPAICSLGEGPGGSRFEAFSHASWTKPAAASLLTSLLPTSHRAMSKGATLSEEVDHIAEVLKEHGYATGGIASNINLAPSFGFDQGYDEYHYLGPDYLAGADESSSKLILYQIARSIWFKLKPGLRFGDFYQDSRVVNRTAFDFLERHQKSRFFLFLHYMDPHDPYFAHPYDGTAIARVANPHPHADQAEEMQRLYGGEIEYLDRNFAELLGVLEALDLMDDTLIALVSDHGEEFYEHGGWWHGLTLYDEQIRVPLLIKWTRRHGAPPAQRESELARLIDVAPTLLQRAGATVPAAMQGVDLAADPANRTARDRQHYAEEDHEGNVLWALRTRDAKLMVANPNNPRGLPERAYFDLRVDPGERRNLVDQIPAVQLAELERHAELQRSFAEGEAVAAGQDVEMSRKECEQLRVLGYVQDCSHIPN
ncbi:MAG: sulfatase-like hydrolase/transferase, partial [Myxococcota bacterium]